MILTEKKQKCSDKNLSHCHFAHHRSYVDLREIESGPRRREDGS